MKKLYILDTNVLLHNPKSLNAFPKEEVVIPLTVIEELDKMKTRMDSVGKNARDCLRTLDSLDNKSDSEDLSSDKGVTLDHEGTLRIELNHIDTLKDKLDIEKMDNRILSVCAYFSNKIKSTKNEYKVILKTNDLALRLKSKAFGILAEAYEDLKLKDLDTIHKGYTFDENKDLNPNEYLVTKGASEGEIEKIERFDGEKMVIKDLSQPLYDIEPRNLEQELALDVLLNPEIPLVTLCGKAGTGKTLMALIAGLHQLENNHYSKMIISRPIVTMGKDIGYLPGSIEEKMDPWMQPIYDNLEYILTKNEKIKEGRVKEKIQSFIEQYNIQVEPLTYIRGRSLPNQFFIIDEAQNLSQAEIKTIVTRVGEGTKVILCGDPEQIDNPYIDVVSNGLSQIRERLKGKVLTAHIELTKGERSPLAEMVADEL